MRAVNLSALRPMRLLRIPEPFDHPDWLFEVKFDGFRALAHVTGHHCQLVSRNGHTFKSWPYLAEEIAHAVRARSAVIDGEIVCLDATVVVGLRICCSAASGRTFWRLMCCRLMVRICARCRSFSASAGLRASCHVSNHG